MEMLYFFLPGIVLLGIITSYEDIRGRGIRNKLVILGLIYSLGVLFSATVYLFLSAQEIILSYILDYFTNIAISLVFGFVIWRAGFWSAGDGKLFLAYSALVPLSVYSSGYIRFFPSFTLFINILFPVFVFLAGSLLLRTSFRKKAEVLKKSFSADILIQVIVSLFGLSWLIKIFFSLSGISYDMFSFLILVPVIYLLVMNLVKRKMKWFFIALFVLRIAFDYSYILSLDFAYQFAYIVVFYVFIRYFIFGLSYEFFSKFVNIQEIKEGMIVADAIHKDGGKYITRQGFPDFLMGQGGRGSPVFNKTGLTGEDVKKLKGLHRAGKIGPKLRIQTTMPFAIFMFLGVVLTIIFQGNILFTLRFMLLG